MPTSAACPALRFYRADGPGSKRRNGQRRELTPWAVTTMTSRTGQFNPASAIRHGDGVMSPGARPQRRPRSPIPRRASPKLSRRAQARRVAWPASRPRDDVDAAQSHQGALAQAYRGKPSNTTGLMAERGHHADGLSPGRRAPKQGRPRMLEASRAKSTSSAVGVSRPGFHGC